MIKRILLTLLLISPFSFADWGDVYYCIMTSNLELDHNGRLTHYKLQKFTFKLDKTQNALVFDESVTNSLPYIIWVDIGVSRPKSEYFKFAFGQGLLLEGKFMYSQTSVDEINSVTADCSKF